MTLLEVTTWMALVVAAGTTLLTAAAVLWPRLETWADRALVVAAGAALVPLGVLAVTLVRGDLGIMYVWENLRTDYPWWLRLAGIWGGQEGTFLLWASVVLGAGVWESQLATGRSWRHARVVVSAVATVLLVPPVLLGLGEATSTLGLTSAGIFAPGGGGPSPLEIRPMGQGLNPLLETPYMAIHPPIEFLAYGLAALPFAYGLVRLSRGGAWREGARRWARASVVAFTAALALGALWAYHVLSFGGYWAWDPVETADLLPWLALLALLHSLPVEKQGGQMGLLAPSLATAGFALAVFATFVTRSGLWSSVHAFLPLGTTIAIEDPMARLVAIVGQETTARFTTGVLIATTGTLGAGAWTFHARTSQAGSWQRAVGMIAAVAWGAVAVAGLLVTEPVVEVLRLVGLTLGGGLPLAGTIVLAGLVALPVIVGLFRAPDDASLHPARRLGQLSLATYALVVTLLATFSLLVLGVNGYDRAVFDTRAPYLAAGILGLILLAFHPGSLERRAGTLAMAAGASLVALVATGSWAWAAAPLALTVAGVAMVDLVSKAAPAGGVRARVRVGLVVTSGVLGLVQWTSPGSVVLLGQAWASPGGYVVLGLVASLVAIVGVFLEDRGLPSWVAPLAGVLAVGYGVGAVLALAGLWLGWDRAPGPSARLKSGAVPMVHVGVALLILGVAASTFGQTVTSFDQVDPLERGVAQQVGPYEIELVDGQVFDEDGRGGPEAVEATVHVRKDGVFLGERTVRLEHSFNTGFTGRGSYVPQDSAVVRGWDEDLLLDADPAVPLSIRVRGTNATWIVANAAPPAGTSGQVDAVSLGVARTPGVNLVWGPIVLIVAGMALRSGWCDRRARPDPGHGPG